MKKLKYLLLGFVVSMVSINTVSALENPTYNTSINVVKNADDTITITATARNTGPTGVGLKQGKFYIYLDEENIVTKASATDGGTTIVATFNGDTLTNCTYANSIVTCPIGKTNAALVATHYSTINDEIVVSFKTELCEGSTDCEIRTEVKGIPIDATTGNPINGTTEITVGSGNFNCSSTMTPNPNPNPNPNSNDPENPDTIDSISLYMLLGSLSLVLLISGVITLNKKKTA